MPCAGLRGPLRVARAFLFGWRVGAGWIVGWLPRTMGEPLFGGVGNDEHLGQSSLRTTIRFCGEFGFGIALALYCAKVASAKRSKPIGMRWVRRCVKSPAELVGCCVASPLCRAALDVPPRAAPAIACCLTASRCTRCRVSPGCTAPAAERPSSLCKRRGLLVEPTPLV